MYSMYMYMYIHVCTCIYILSSALKDDIVSLEA